MPLPPSLPPSSPSPPPWQRRQVRQVRPGQREESGDAMLCGGLAGGEGEAGRAGGREGRREGGREGGRAGTREVHGLLPKEACKERRVSVRIPPRMRYPPESWSLPNFSTCCGSSPATIDRKVTCVAFPSFPSSGGLRWLPFSLRDGGRGRADLWGRGARPARARRQDEPDGALPCQGAGGGW